MGKCNRPAGGGQVATPLVIACRARAAALLPRSVNKKPDAPLDPLRRKFIKYVLPKERLDFNAPQVSKGGTDGCDGWLELPAFGALYYLAVVLQPETKLRTFGLIARSQRRSFFKRATLSCL